MNIERLKQKQGELEARIDRLEDQVAHTWRWVEVCEDSQDVTDEEVMKAYDDYDKARKLLADTERQLRDLHKGLEAYYDAIIYLSQFED